ncbi:MAG: hypothetical protein R2827_01195 [Bdellovibrionales bacterium]
MFISPQRSRPSWCNARRRSRCTNTASSVFRLNPTAFTYAMTWLKTDLELRAKVASRCRSLRIYTTHFFKYLENTPPGKNGEIQLTDPMAQLAQNERSFATIVTVRKIRRRR